MSIDDVARQYQNDHPGYLLTDWYEAALPSYELRLRIRVLAKQQLLPVEQYVLKLASAGVGSLEELASVLGIDHSMATAAIDHLERVGCLTVVPEHKDRQTALRLMLTKKGNRVLDELNLDISRMETFTIYVDALTKQYYRRSALHPPRTVKTEEKHQIPVSSPTPSMLDLDTVILKRLWREQSKELSTSELAQTELIDVLELERCVLGYRIMGVLQYIRPDDNDVQVHIYDGVERSLPHETVVLAMQRERPRVLRTESRPPAGASTATDAAMALVGLDDYRAAKRRAEELPRLTAAIEERKVEQQEAQKRRQGSAPDEQVQIESDVQDTDAEIQMLKQQVTELRAKAPHTEWLSMVDHRPRLLRVFDEAKERVIIVSPWLTRAAVNYEFRQAMHRAMERGIKVMIAYGFGESKDEEKQVAAKLDEMARSPAGQNLRIKRTQDSHSKVMICDDKYVIATSFNFLSFAGQPDRGNRLEYGILAYEARTVQSALRDVLRLFDTDSH